MLRPLLLLSATLLVIACSRPGKWENSMAQGRRHLQRQDHEKARKSFDRALVLRPGNPDALMGRAAALVGLSRLPEALADMDAAIAVQPRAEWRARRGMVLYTLGRLPEALADLDFVLAAHPGHAPSLAARGMVHLRLRHCAAAAADLAAARKRGVPVPEEWSRACQAEAAPSQPDANSNE